MTLSRIWAIGLAALVTLALLITGPMLVENLDSSEVMVVQSPVAGDLSVHVEPGWKWQGFGSFVKYPRRNEFRFQDAVCLRNGGKVDGQPDITAQGSGLSVRFYDGGNATLCGTISWEMPLDPKSVIEIHRAFRSPQAVETQAIRRAMESAAYFSGPTMSSLESAAGRRNELLQMINDQMINGVYRTTSRKVTQTDVAGVERQMIVTEIDKDDAGMPIRAQESYVKKYNVTMLPITISAFAYEQKVEEQIREQQQATNAVQVAAANAKRAEQDAKTAKSQGEADATKAEWVEKTIQAKAIAAADAAVVVANAAVKEAEAFKKSEILRGEGEATRKRLVLEADGALDKKLEALVSINKNYAEAIAAAQPGAWVPSVSMGGGGQSGGVAATNLVELLTAKTAKDMAVDLGVAKGAVSKK
jgi:hypothetical protein